MDPPSTASLDFRRLDPCACAGGAENRRPSSTCLHVEDLMKSAFTRHWPEYGMEALGLGLFMLSANGCGPPLPPGVTSRHRGRRRRTSVHGRSDGTHGGGVDLLAVGTALGP